MQACGALPSLCSFQIEIEFLLKERGRKIVLVIGARSKLKQARLAPGLFTQPTNLCVFCLEPLKVAKRLVPDKTDHCRVLSRSPCERYCRP